MSNYVSKKYVANEAPTIGNQNYAFFNNKSADLQLSVALIIPAYNEAETIAQTISGFHDLFPDVAIYVIDNNSSDDTGKIARDLLATLSCEGGVMVEKSQGKGRAVRRAFHSIEADVYVMVDADTTYSPHDLVKMIRYVAYDDADMVVGDRHSAGDYKKENNRPFHNVGNSLVTKLINTFFNADLVDILSGYRVFSRKFVKNYPIMCRGFELETEVTLHALDKGFRIVEVPISYQDRPEGSSSKLNTYLDGIRILKTIFWIFKDYRPLLFFSSLSFLFFCFGLGAGTPVILEFIRTGLILHIPLAILSTGLMIFSLLLLSVGLILDTVVKLNKTRFEIDLLNSRPHQQ